jgi:predicted Zn-dependent protease
MNNYKSFSLMLMNNILTERGEFQKCSELMKETIKVDPNNAYLWMCLGGCQFNKGNPDDAITSMTKAVELLPEKGPYRGQLARVMEQYGRLDEAEKHFRMLLKIEPDNPVVHFWLAQFLAKHRPSMKEEALKEAQFALSLPAKGRIPKQIIEKLIAELQANPQQEQDN